MNKFRSLVLILSFAILYFSLTGGDCGTETNDPVLPKTVAPPQNITLKLGADPVDPNSDENSYAVISWEASTDEPNTDFKGYRVITQELNASNQIVTIFQEQFLNKSSRIHTINNINPTTKYRTVVVSELTDGVQSDSVITPIYSGVYYNNNGSIDSYTNTGNSQSGYGWNVNNGEGIQYTYSQINANKIDLHLRESTGILFFKSPDFLDDLNGTNYRYTKIKLIGYGQDVFDEVTLDIPDRTEAAVSQDGVYLLETEEGNFIKIFVRLIEQTGTPQYFNVQFDYKVQPVSGLPIAKK